MENVFYNPDQNKTTSRRHLPHWCQKGKLYFVTFRLADSIPEEKLLELKREQELFLKTNFQPFTQIQNEIYRNLFFVKIENWLDQFHGSCLLKEQKYSMIVKDAFDYFDGQRYDLDHWVIMPNHVHVILLVYENYQLKDILHSWKSYTSNAINKLAQQEGKIWQHESFDHIIRSENYLQKYREYIIDNKVKTGRNSILLSKNMIKTE